MTDYAKVSVHGGHSGSFCGHATDTLEDVVARYAELGFEWVCLTEHMPTRTASLMADEEAAAGFDVPGLQARFADYFQTARRLTAEYQDRMKIFVGFETEAYSGYQAEVSELIERYQPDMLVGSVHHLYDILFDGSPEHYRRAVAQAGDIETLYCDYFDVQLELIERFEPAVVGHFDLIRIHDPDYAERWRVPAIRDRALRNLRRIRELDLILDLNVRALVKGADEPYISKPWLEFAIANNIAVTPGDDSHGVANVGGMLDQAVAHLKALGGTTEWRQPPRHRHRTV